MCMGDHGKRPKQSQIDKIGREPHARTTRSQLAGYKRKQRRLKFVERPPTVLTLPFQATQHDSIECRWYFGTLGPRGGRRFGNCSCYRGCGISALERRPPGEQKIERRSDRVNVRLLV